MPAVFRRRAKRDLLDAGRGTKTGVSVSATSFFAMSTQRSRGYSRIRTNFLSTTIQRGASC